MGSTIATIIIRDGDRGGNNMLYHARVRRMRRYLEQMGWSPEEAASLAGSMVQMSLDTQTHSQLKEIYEALHMWYNKGRRACYEDDL